MNIYLKYKTRMGVHVLVACRLWQSINPSLVFPRRKQILARLNITAIYLALESNAIVSLTTCSIETCMMIAHQVMMQENKYSSAYYIKHAC